MRLSEERREESFDLLRKHLVRFHADKDNDSLFVRLGEIMQDFDELRFRVKSYESVLKILSKGGHDGEQR